MIAIGLARRYRRGISILPSDSPHMTDDPAQIGDDLPLSTAVSVLESRGHGVLCLARANDAYGIPVSYGYEREHNRFIFEFLHIGESKKQAFVSSSNEVTLVVYSVERKTDWTSVIVTGMLTPATTADLPERSIATFTSQADDGAEEVRWAGAADLDREYYVLHPTDISGRRREMTSDKS